MEIWKDPEVVIFWLLSILLFIILLIAAFYALYMKSLSKMHALEIAKKNSEMEAQFDLSQSVIKSQESERERIARDMHDSFIGELVRMQYKVGMDQSVSAAEIRELVTKSRTIIHDLSPPMINESSIDMLIEAEIKRYADCFEYKIQTNFTSHYTMESDTKINIVRIFQELLQNTFKYANASMVSTTILQRGNLLLLTYQDICRESTAKMSTDFQGGNGHKNIKFRNQYLKSSYKLNYKVGVGLKYIMVLKLKNEKST